MNNKIIAFATVAVIGLLSFQVKSDEPTPQTPPVNRPYTELRSTLTEAFRLRLDEYKAGHASPANVIRVNGELYDVQRHTRIVGRETDAQEKYVARAREIAQIAKANLDDGTGNKMDLLDATASRLRAEMELENARKAR